MAFRLSTKARNAACDAIVDLLDEGASAGLCRIRTGAQPTNVGDAESGTLLGTLTFTDPAFGASATGTATASAITSDSSADASGTAGHARFMDSDAEVMFDAECAQGSGTVNFNNTTIVAGGTIAISAMTVTQPIS
jgi:hypothetical protein